MYKPMDKTGEHEYLLPLDGQTIDGTTYKRLVDYLGTTTLPNLNGRYLRADTTPGTMVEAGLPNITGTAQFRTINIQDNNLIFGCSNALNKSISAWPGGHSAVTTTQYEPYNLENLNIDASKSSAVYGKSDTVTPLTYTVRAYIAYA